MNDLEKLEQDLLQAVAASGSVASLEAVRVDALGKKSSISLLMKRLGGLSLEERKEKGPLYNKIKRRIEQAIESRKVALEMAELDAKLAAERVDVTLSARPEGEGRIHPISQALDEVLAIFGAMSFAVAEGPDIEDDFHNFTALNIPPEHPARQMHDTFYLPGERDGSQLVLRTHTSPVQVRTMQIQKPPLRIIAPGRTYRSDSDMTHTPMFHQVEGLVVDEHAHMGHLKGCVTEFCRAYFEIADLPLRFRPSFFPFTEPSAEVDIGCLRKDGELKIG
ncbi:MAG TPA: phenylalanine--tRNA ligase subunit alpha, partial [Alphaproteobacteria bacterium]|nr:phenylalanine--tRNA ligase subunit alpha [Alphaproteobacteria bacterium]